MPSASSSAGAAIATSDRAVSLTLRTGSGVAESVATRIRLRRVTFPCNCLSLTLISPVTPTRVRFTAAGSRPETVTSRTDPVVVVV